MKLLKHDIWDLWEHGYTICVCTNGFIKKDGTAVMGRGIALEASERIPRLRKELAEKLDKFGNLPFWFKEYRMVTFPTKHVWWEESDLDLIRHSSRTLRGMTEFLIPHVNRPQKEVVFLPIPGIGNGKLDKKNVMPILEEELENCKHIIIVEKP